MWSSKAGGGQLGTCQLAVRGAAVRQPNARRVQRQRQCQLRQMRQSHQGTMAHVQLDPTQAATPGHISQRSA
jgi:hypothetical protein